MDSKISAGQTQIPYQELSYSLAAGESLDIFQVFNYFRVMAIDASGLLLKFGQNGLITPFSGQGIGIQLAYTYDRVTLINNSGGVMNITIALALGQVNDDRLNVSSALAINSVIPGVGATNLGKAEDAAHASGDTGVAVWGVRNDSVALQPTSNNGDYSPLSTDSRGRIFARKMYRGIITSQTSVGNVATLLLATTADIHESIIYAGTDDLYIGGANTVTTGNGFLIPANSSLALDGHIGNLYAIRAGAASTCYLLYGNN